MARQYYQPRAFPRVTMPTPAPLPDPLRTLSGLANLAHGVESLRAFKDDRAREDQARAAQDTLARTYEASGGDWPETTRRLRDEGNHTLADQAESAFTQRRTETLEALGAEYRAQSDGFTVASRLIQGIQAAPPPDQPQAFVRVRDRILDAVGPDLGSHVPSQWDPQWGQRALERGLETADILKIRGAVVERARQGVKDQNELYDTYAPGLGTAQSADDYAEMVDSIVALHPELDARGLRLQIGDYSEDNLARLRGHPPPGATEASSDYGRALARHANSLGKSPGQLTTEDELAFRRQFMAAGRPPPVEPERPTGPSPAQIGAAERALYSGLVDLQDRQKNKYDYKPLTDEEYQERRLRLYNTYRRSQGWPSWTRVPTPPTPGDEDWVPNPVLMRSPDGEEGWVSEANVTAAQAQGGVIVPMPSMP